MYQEQFRVSHWCQSQKRKVYSQTHSNMCQRYLTLSLQEYRRNSLLNPLCNELLLNDGCSPCNKPVHDQKGISIHCPMTFPSIRPTLCCLWLFWFRIGTISSVLFLIAVEYFHVWIMNESMEAMGWMPPGMWSPCLLHANRIILPFWKVPEMTIFCEFHSFPGFSWYFRNILGEL